MVKSFAQSMRRKARRHAPGNSSSFGQAVLANLRGWQRGELLKIRRVARMGLKK
jgi:hypothetical protein